MARFGGEIDEIFVGGKRLKGTYQGTFRPRQDGDPNPYDAFDGSGGWDMVAPVRIALVAEGSGSGQTMRKIVVQLPKDGQKRSLIRRMSDGDIASAFDNGSLQALAVSIG